MNKCFTCRMRKLSLKDKSQFAECIKLGKAFSSSVPVIPQVMLSAFRVAEEGFLLSQIIS